MPALRLARLAGVAAVQDQPVVGVAPEGLRHNLLEPGLDRIDILPGSKAGAVADTKDVSVDGESFLAEGGVEHDVGGLSAHSGKFLQILSSSRNLGAVIFDQRFAQCDDVFRLGVEQADRPDRVA